MSGPAIRRLESDDILNGFLESLDALRKASGLDAARATAILERINSNLDHTILVAELDGKIVGAITLLIEPKFIHDGGLVGHIEDVVVRDGFQGMGIGALLVKASLELARKRRCYKTVLECTDEVRPFYEKLGFHTHSRAMRFDH